MKNSVIVKSMRGYAAALRPALRTAPMHCFLVFCLSFSEICARIISALVLKFGIDITLVIVFQQNYDGVFRLVVLTCIFAIAEFYCHVVLKELFETQFERIRHHIHRSMVRKYSLHDDIEREKKLLEGTILERVLELPGDAMSVIIWNILLLGFSWWIVPITLCGAMLGATLEKRFTLLANSSKRKVKIHEVMDAHVQSIADSAKEIGPSGDTKIGRMRDDLLDRTSDKLSTMLTRGQIYNILAAMLSRTVTVWTTLILAPTAIMQIITIGDFFYYRIAVSNSTRGLQDISDLFNIIANTDGRRMARRIGYTIEEKLPAADKKIPVSAAEEPPPVRGTFGYDDGRFGCGWKIADGEKSEKNAAGR